MSRFEELLRTMPPATVGAIALCCALYLVQIVADIQVTAVSLCPRLVFSNQQVYRIITSALFHANLMHIGMNMLSVSTIGAMLEKRIGTLRIIATMLWSILLTAAIYLGAALLVSSLGLFGGLYNQHSIGFSGVIFHLSVLECNLSPHETRSLFGMFTVPTYVYPWVLLFLLQMFMPNLSFLGHLAGILTGTLQLYGMLDCLMPSQAKFTEMESWNSLRPLSTRPAFCSTTSLPSRASSSGSALRQFSGRMSTFIFHGLDKIKVAIFGRGRAENSNIQLVSGHDNDDDDDDWSGLPAAQTSAPDAATSHIV